MAATHPANLNLVNEVWFSEPIPETDQKEGTQNALSLLSFVACDPRFEDIKRMEVPTMLRSVLQAYGPVIREYVEMWKFDATSDAGIASAVEELSWVNTMIYGVGGHLSSQKFRADLLLVHLLTSSFFLASLLANISKVSSRRAFLLTYFTASLAFYLGRGRPALDLRAFYNDTEHLLHQVPGLDSSLAPGTFPSPSSDSAQMSNAWLPLIQSGLVSPNTHLCKLHRALAHYSCLYGKHRKGWARLIGEGAEDKVGLGELDGTLFLRVAMLTQNRLGWRRGGNPEQHWDLDGFFEQDELLKSDVSVARPVSSTLLSHALSFHFFASTYFYLISLAPLLASTFDLFYHTSRRLLLGYQTLQHFLTSRT